MASGLIQFEDALARLLEGAGALGVEEVPLAAAHGRVLARPIRAERDAPPADLSAMDGYAVPLEGWPGPWRVIGEAAAGGALVRALGSGEAARIFTGAAVPAGADAILIQENAERDGERVTAKVPAPPPGHFIRKRGADFAADATAGTPGQPVTPQLIALAAAFGHGTLPVRRRPCVAVLTTGDELAPPGIPPGEGRITDCGSAMIEAMLGRVADVLPLGIAPDRLDMITAALGRAREADIIVTIGGASVGDRDLIRPALQAAGGEIGFWRIALRPGKPLMAGTFGPSRVLGLPGNPVSAFVTGTLFLLPLARALGGWAEPVRPPLAVRLGSDLPANDERRDHLRARIENRAGELWAMPLPFERQDSSFVLALAEAHVLLIRPPHAPPVPLGTFVNAIDIRFGQI